QFDRLEDRLHRRDASRLGAACAKRDEVLKEEVRRVFDENFGVYGVRKVWRQMKREGFDIARCTVARLMKSMGLQGVIRGKPVKTTISDKAAPCPSARAMALVRGCRVRDAGMGRLVQQSPAARTHRQHPAGRSRGTLLRYAGSPTHG